MNEVISQQTARTMMTLLRAVTAHGTGAAAAQLNHPLGGKTGTTSDFTDAWFLGFSPSVTCGVWVGYDSRESLGEKETGARAALPIWMDFMSVAIVGNPDEQFLGEQEGIPMDEAIAAPPVKPGPAPLPLPLAQPPKTVAVKQLAKPVLTLVPASRGTAPTVKPVIENLSSPAKKN